MATSLSVSIFLSISFTIVMSFTTSTPWPTYEPTPLPTWEPTPLSTDGASPTTTTEWPTYEPTPLPSDASSTTFTTSTTTEWPTYEPTPLPSDASSTTSTTSTTTEWPTYEPTPLPSYEQSTTSSSSSSSTTTTSTTTQWPTYGPTEFPTYDTSTSTSTTPSPTDTTTSISSTSAWTSTTSETSSTTITSTEDLGTTLGATTFDSTSESTSTTPEIASTGMHDLCANICKNNCCVYNIETVITTSDVTQTVPELSTSSSTETLTGVSIRDRDESDRLFDDWIYIIHVESLNHKPYFVYNDDENDISSDLQYDASNGWIIKIQIGSGTITIYASDQHDLMDLFGDEETEWITFRELGGNRRLLQWKEFLISRIFDDPTISSSSTSSTTGKVSADAAGQETSNGAFNSSMFGESTDIIIFILFGVIVCCIVISSFLFYRMRKKSEMDRESLKSKSATVSIEMHDNGNRDTTTTKGEEEIFHIQATSQEQLTIPTNMHAVMQHNSTSSIPSPYSGYSPGSAVLPHSPGKGDISPIQSDVAQAQRYPSNKFVYNNVYIQDPPSQLPPQPQVNVSLPGATPGDQFDDGDYEQQEYGSIPPSHKLEPGMKSIGSGEYMNTGDFIGGVMAEESETNDEMWDPNARKISHETRR